MPSISRTDARLISGHVHAWQNRIDRIPPGTVLSRDELLTLLETRYVTTYQLQLFGALLRYSIAKDDLREVGELFLRIGAASHSEVSFMEMASRGGLSLYQILPQNRLSAARPTTDIISAHVGWRRAINTRTSEIRAEISAFAWNVGGVFRWMILSQPIYCETTKEMPIISGITEQEILARFELLAEACGIDPVTPPDLTGADRMIYETHNPNTSLNENEP